MKLAFGFTDHQNMLQPCQLAPCSLVELAVDQFQMKFFFYNPLSLIQPGRLLQIARQLNSDVILFPGTCMRTTPGDTHHFESVGQQHWAVHAGYGSGPFTNKAAGCTIILRSCKFPRKHVQSTAVPPKQLQGRGIRVRCKNQNHSLDINFIREYVAQDGFGANATTIKGARTNE